MLLSRFADQDPVLIDAATGRLVLRRDIDRRGIDLTPNLTDGGLAFVLVDGSLESAIDLHAALGSELAVALIDASMPGEQLTVLVNQYRPDLVLAGDAWPGIPGYVEAGHRVWRRTVTAPTDPLHPDLCVLLTTSGSTGSPKFVRLSRANIEANASQIAASLQLTPADRGVTALPVHYSFGMSVLTSHAWVGSPVVVTTASVIEPTFWQQLADFSVTLLPGVPQTYQMLTRLRFHQRFLPQTPSLRALMQAGGRLAPELISTCAQAMAERGGQFFVMYGQTEAAPRMACLPPERLSDKLGSVGVPMPGGSFAIHGEDGSLQPPTEAGEVFYTGPNVMMGYATSRDDLGRGDDHGDTLATGDLGYLDDEGYLFLTGRTKRIAKVAGMRVSLDEIEALATTLGLPGAVAVEAPEGVITVATADPGSLDVQAVADQIRRATRLPAKSVRAEVLAALPLLGNGKIDYLSVRAAVSGTQAVDRPVARDNGA